MNEPKAIDYVMSKDDAQYLMGACQLPSDLRIEILNKYLEEHGQADLVNLFAQFIGLANSTVANNREMIELYLITDHDHHPETAHKINLPTIFGALSGAGLSAGIDQSKLCETCAYRLGSPPNQSPVTTCDADYCSDESFLKFMCHHDLDDDGKPTKACAGYAQVMAKRKGQAA